MIARELIAAENREVDVEKVFGPDGIWAELVANGEGYLGSEVVCESRLERRYRAFDYWVSHLAFESFRRARQFELEQFAKLIATEGLLAKESFLGAYYEPDIDEGTDIVPA